MIDMDANQFTTPDDAIEHGLTMLTRAAIDRKSPMRWPVLCTIGPSGRVVVLRQFDRDTRTCQIFTDQRTAKMRDLASSPKAELVFFDPSKMLQIRLSGAVRTVTSGPIWDAALRGLPDTARQDYAALLPPGASLKDATSQLDPATISGNFAILEIAGEVIDWLCLGRTGHRRARGYWPSEGAPRSDWLVP